MTGMMLGLGLVILAAAVPRLWSLRRSRETRRDLVQFAGRRVVVLNSPQLISILIFRGAASFEMAAVRVNTPFDNSAFTLFGSIGLGKWIDW
jgi:hypothetical protein